MTALVVATTAAACTTGTEGERITLGAGQESTGMTAPPPRPRPTIPPDDSPSPPPVGPGTEIGTPYEFQLYTHCGIEWARIDGAWWTTKPLNDGSGNPPRAAGWGNPFDDGTLTLIDHDTAEYLSGAGHRLRFARTTADGPPFVCG